jgi:hypothetical protein
MFEAPIPRLETRDFTIGIAAVDDFGPGAEKLWRSVAEKSLSTRARAHATRSDRYHRCKGRCLRRTTRLLACSRDDRACAGGERMYFVKPRDRVAVMVRASDQRLFGESLPRTLIRGGDRLAEKRMRHSIAARARPDSKGTGRALATRIAGSDSCQCVLEIGNVALCEMNSF